MRKVLATMTFMGNDGCVRLLVVLDTPNFWRGCAIAGTPARVAFLADALRRSGVEVAWLVCDRGVDPAELPLAGGGWLVHPDVFYGPARRLAAAVAGFAPELVVVTDAELAVATRALADGVGARLVYEAHDDERALSASLGEPAPLAAQRGAWQPAAVAMADYVIALTGANAATLRGYGVPPERLLVLPNGVEIATRTEWGPDVQAHRLLFVGNLHYQPNAQAVTALTAMVARLRAHGMLVRARIVGRGPAPASGSPEVVLRGPVPAPRFDAEFRGISLAVAPLTAGSGMKMLDYLAAGLPVLATREAVTGLPVAVPGVVICDDLAAWPERITELLAIPGELAELGRAGRRFVEQHHDWEDLAVRAVSAYRAWCAQPAPPRRRAAVPVGSGEPRWQAEHRWQGALGRPRATVVDPVAVLEGMRR